MRKKLSISLQPYENEEVRQAAEIAGVTISSWCRRALLERARREKSAASRGDQGESSKRATYSGRR